ncbi:NADP-dependent oxidoreductase domain-containing protein [Pavlovales sp. CCMP2436]|nr:NADP-dependent oxidoreductase domain-containing protein [Pavlovales sp. CCMP2436]
MHRMEAMLMMLCTQTVHALPVHDPPGGGGKEIAPGVRMPWVSLGHPDDNSTMASGVDMWLRLGGVGIDTAWIYRNQAQVADGIERSGRGRDSVFLTTKIPCFPSAETAMAFVLEDLRELRTGYVDLMLLHEPCESFEVSPLGYLRRLP